MSIFDLQEPPPLVLPARTAGRLRRHYPAALTAQCLLAPSTIFTNFLLQVCNKTAPLKARWKPAATQGTGVRGKSRPIRGLSGSQQNANRVAATCLGEHANRQVKSLWGGPSAHRPTAFPRQAEVAHGPAGGPLWRGEGDPASKIAAHAGR